MVVTPIEREDELATLLEQLREETRGSNSLSVREKALRNLFDHFLVEMLRSFADKENPPNAATMGVIRQFLRDNGLTIEDLDAAAKRLAGASPRGSAGAEEMDLPRFEDEEDDALSL